MSDSMAETPTTTQTTPTTASADGTATTGTSSVHPQLDGLGVGDAQLDAVLFGYGEAA